MRSFADIRLLSDRHKISVSAPASWESPFTAYRKLAGKDSFLLESVSGPPQIARYSIIGIEPHTIFRAKGAKVKLMSDGDEETIVGDPFAVLRQVCSHFETHSTRKFTGAAVGYFSYDLARFIETLPSLADDDLDLPEAVFLFPAVFVVFDHAQKSAEILVMVDDTGKPRQDYAAAQQKISQVVARLSKPVEPFVPRMTGRQAVWGANLDKQEFMEMVKKAKEYIFAGDIYQVNLSQRLSAAVECSPLAIYAVLRELNPSPFAGFFDFGDWSLVGCSPERLIKLENGIIQTRPIAGTVRRGTDRAEDAELRDRLTADLKERAEHVMLVDLERNDLGRVCDYGSVRVNELITTESYSHVTHIVSNITGSLRPGENAFDLIRACFPGGTITGCPKVRAMEVIEELERVRRGPYTGSMGYIGFNGALDLNIIIRTLLIKEGRAYVQAGAGIVADSDPEREYYETLHKAQALVQATTIAEEQHGCLPT